MPQSKVAPKNVNGTHRRIVTERPLKKVGPRVQRGRVNLGLRDKAGAERPLGESGRGCSESRQDP